MCITARRRRLSFGRDEFLSSAKKSAVTDLDENRELEDANKNVVVGGGGVVTIGDDEPGTNTIKLFLPKLNYHKITSRF